MLTKNIPLRVKAGPADGLAEGVIEFYASTFTDQPDSYGDVVMPGAFDEDIAAWAASGGPVSVLYGHNQSKPDYNVGGADASTGDYAADDHGLFVRARLDMDNEVAAQVYRLAKAKRLRQGSFAYDVLDEGTVTRADGTKVNELRKLKVYEVSLVPVGANQDTAVIAVKSLRTEVASEVAAIKAGRMFSAMNESTLKQIGADASGVASDITSLLAQMGGDNNQGKASGTPEAKSETDAEEPLGVNAPVLGEEQKVSPSARILAETQLLAHGI
jgi:uncharacterized protein